MNWLTILHEKIHDIKNWKSWRTLQALCQERGAVFVLTAMLLPVLCGFMGLAYDAGNVYMHKARLQNVTDAAALAGGAVFGVKDQTTDRKQGNKIFMDGVSHKDADDEAKRYINQNKINLGNEITVEELSALAYQGDPTTDSATKKVTQNTDIYYRVIASEKVPLYFIPVIFNKHEQDVRTVSVALAKTTTVTTPGSTDGGGDNPRQPITSIFNNLFTYSDELSTNPVYVHDGNAGTEAIAAYQGTIAYTHGNDPNSYYATTGQNGSSTSIFNHFYENKTGDTLEQRIHSADDNITKVINDPTINTFFKTTDYLEALKNWLNGPHIEIKERTGNVRNHFDLSDINNPGSYFYASGLISNVFYINNGCNLEINIKGKINNQIGNKFYDDYTPIYLITAADVNVNNIQIANNVRPVVLVYLGTGTLWLQGTQNGDNQNLTVYAPYATIRIQNYNGTFHGNIIGEKILSDGSNKGTWIQQNFLENENYIDQNVSNVSKRIEQDVKAANEALTDQLRAEIAKALGIDEDKLGNTAWYQQQVYADKQSYYNKWRALYNQYKDNEDLRNILWPFNDFFGLGIKESEGSVTTNSTLRLIDPRTEDNPYYNGQSDI